MPEPDRTPSAASPSERPVAQSPQELPGDDRPGVRGSGRPAGTSSAAYTPPVGMKSLERKLMQNGDGTHLDPEWAEVRVVMRERTALLTAVEGLLDVGERSRSGDPSLDPEEWYAIRDYARKVLNDATD